MSVIELKNLTKVFDGEKALDHLTLNLEGGNLIAIVGPDGAGKTTLLRLLAGLLLPTEGTIRVLGLDPTLQAEELHKVIGYMPGRFGLYEDLTVMENMNLYADLQGLVGEKKGEAFERLLNFAGLTPFKERLAGNLSGGMKQKLGLVATLMRKPKVLLLDEPSVGVDPLSRRELWKMVEELVESGVTALWSTSYLDEAEKCKEVLVLDQGKLLFQGAPQTLTDEVKGRVFQVDVHENKRELLNALLKNDDVMDGTVFGETVRILLKEGAKPPPLTSGSWRVATPRFEDAFINRLGGVPMKESPLARHRPKTCSDPIVIRAENLVKNFGSFVAVDNITFQVKRGEIFVLLGPNGAGKTTTFRMLCGLLQPTSGASYVEGISFQTASSKARERIGYMSQKFSLYGNLTVEQNLAFFAGIYPIRDGNEKRAIGEMVEIFELKELLREAAGQIPIGFQRRLALAASLMHDPAVLFLDEPTSGVDPVTRREFWGHISALVSNGVTVMVTTHFMDEAELGDRLALINRGKIITIGTPEELKARAGCETLEEAFIALSGAS